MKITGKTANDQPDTQHSALLASEAGINVLNNIQEKLRSSEKALVEKLHSSGKPPDNNQTAMEDAYSKANKRINTIKSRALNNNTDLGPATSN